MKKIDPGFYIAQGLEGFDLKGFKVIAYEKIKIKETREIVHTIQQKSTSENPLKLVLKSESIPDDAQNTLLKAVEELGQNKTFVLSVVDFAQVLDTLMSRAQILGLDSRFDAELFADFLSQTPGVREKILEESDINFRQFVNELIKYLIQEKLYKKNTGIFVAMEKLQSLNLRHALIQKFARDFLITTLPVLK